MLRRRSLVRSWRSRAGVRPSLSSVGVAVVLGLRDFSLVLVVPILDVLQAKRHLQVRGGLQMR